MILYENMKPIEHVLLQSICVHSHLMCTCKHCDMKLSFYHRTQWSCWWFYHFTKTDLTRFFIIKPRHPDRPENADLGEKKPAVGALDTVRQNAYYPNLKWTFEDSLPWYCYAIKTNSRTIRWQVSQFASVGKGADMSELQSHYCITPEQWTGSCAVSVSYWQINCHCNKSNEFMVS